MANKSKFKVGMEVKSILNDTETYEVIEVLKNDLKVRTTKTNIEYQCRKSLFEVIEQ